MDIILQDRKRKEGYKLRVKRTGFEDDLDLVWRLHENVRSDLQRVIEDFSLTPSDRSIKEKKRTYIFYQIFHIHAHCSTLVSSRGTKTLIIANQCILAGYPVINDHCNFVLHL